MWRQLMGRERGRRDGLVGEEKRKMPERNEREGGRQLGSQTWWNNGIQRAFLWFILSLSLYRHRLYKNIQYTHISLMQEKHERIHMKTHTRRSWPFPPRQHRGVPWDTTDASLNKSWTANLSHDTAQLWIWLSFRAILMTQKCLKTTGITKYRSYWVFVESVYTSSSLTIFS